MNYNLMAYRPEAELIALMQQAQERLEFHAQQIAQIQHAQTKFAQQQGMIVQHYVGLMDQDRKMIQEMSVYLDGGSAEGFDPNAAAVTETNEDLIRKQELLARFNAVGDHTPKQAFGGRTAHDVVAKAKPVPQSKVEVVHYAPGEELPPEAIGGHMPENGPEPRSAEELRKAQVQIANGTPPAASAVSAVIEE
jgi:hypothetical protein